ncbi:hypothetical protein SAMN05421803_10354 [Nocardiopsis flavescens]|uniref:Secreted protein n=1 Tax=Nocardiopsis flavescens TaxID=758803 RepID=A0A1M6FJK9_9ACTN|nr:hypothetical protein SAMN05421803_10354 [Nocardiopsis flavescens]
MASVPTLTSPPSRACALLGAAALVLTVAACGDGHGYTPDELDGMVADSAGADGPGSGATAPPETVFDPELLLCTPAVDTAGVPGEGSWSTEAPRSAVGEGPVELGLLPPEDVEPTGVTITVRTPADEIHVLETDTVPGEWAHVRYPEEDGAELAPGVYTAVWSDTATGTPLTCDGFEV